MNKKTTALAAPAAMHTKIDGLLALKKIEEKDIDGLSAAEREVLGDRLTRTLAGSEGEERDNFLAKIDPILPESTKNDLWGHNHQAIGSAISEYMREYGLMPSKSAIAEATGLSRQTVVKHLKEYKTHPEFVAEAEQFKYMSEVMLANVFKFASKGDMRAARLYFEMVGTNKPHNGAIATAQNNYIQINNTILSQENLKQLSAEQLQQIENIIARRVIETPAVAV